MSNLPWSMIGVGALVVGLIALRFFLPGRGRTGQGRAVYLIIRIAIIVVVLGFAAWRYWANRH